MKVQAVMTDIDKIQALLHEMPAYMDSSNALESYILQRNDVLQVKSYPKMSSTDT